MSDLHSRLIARQTTAELRRKAEKARATLWTQEEIDYVERVAEELWQAFQEKKKRVK